MKPFLLLVDLDRPLKWDTLCRLPDDIQRDYLNRLKTEFRASDGMIAIAMYSNFETVRRRCRELGVLRAGRVSAADRRSWKTWLARKDYTADMTDAARRALLSSQMLSVYKPEVRAL